MLLFPKTMITESLLAMILLKVGSSGLTMAYYLYRTRPASQKTGIVLFSTMYALTAYSVVQAHNTMWIDNLILLPLITLGIERLISRGRYKLFIVTFAMAILSNFYIGYMMCIYVFVYFFYWYIAHNDEFGNNFYRERRHFVKSLGRVALAAVIVLMIASIIILPTWYSLNFGKTNFSNPTYQFVQKFDFLDFTTKFFFGSYDTVRPEGLPFVYCGTLALIFLPLYFVAKNIKAREKALGGLLLAFFVFSFNCSVIDMVWHGFQKPNWLNYRYSFMFCFFVLVLAYKAFCERDKISMKSIIAVCGALGIILMLIQKQSYKYVDDLTMIWVSLGLLGTVYRSDLPRVARRAARGGTGRTGLCGLRRGVHRWSAEHRSAGQGRRNQQPHGLPHFYGQGPAAGLTQLWKTTTACTAWKRIPPQNQRLDGAGFLRVVQLVSSTLNASVIKLLAQLGYASKSHWSKYLGGTPVSDSLLGIKYLILDDATNQYLYQMLAYDDENNYRTYENPYALSIAYAVSDKLGLIDAESYVSPMELMNAIVTLMLGEDETVEIFKPVEVVDDTSTYNCEMSYTTGHRRYAATVEGKDAKLSYTLRADNKYEIFCYFPTDTKREVSMTVNGTDRGTVFGNDTDRIISLGTMTPRRGVRRNSEADRRRFLRQDRRNLLLVPRCRSLQGPPSLVWPRATSTSTSILTRTSRAALLCPRAARCCLPRSHMTRVGRLLPTAPILSWSRPPARCSR